MLECFIQRVKSINLDFSIKYYFIRFLRFVNDGILTKYQKLQNFVDLENFTFKKKTKGRSSRIFSGPWDVDSFYSFWSALNEKQKEFVKIVYENEEILRENLIKDLIKEKVLIKDDPKLKNYFAGLSAGLTRKWNNLE